MSEIALVKFLFRKDWSPLEEVIDKFSKEFGDIYDVGDDRDIIQVVTTSPATLVFACITDKDDLTKVLGFLKLQRRYVKEGNVKFSVINFLNNKQVEMALLKLGCQEVIDPGLKAKALKFKMDFWKKSLSVGTNKILEGAQVQSLKDKVAADKKAVAAEDKKAAQVKPITWTDALKVVDDMWLTKNPNDVKKILSRWMVKLMGPSPFVAQWMEVQGERNVWEFVFKDGVRENFHMADGSWFFSGDQKPEFMWKENVWLITGQKFQLFYQEDTKVDYRLRATAQAVEVTKNSNYAISREQAIIDSFDQEVLMKKGLIDDTKTALEGETDAPRDGLLTEQIDGAENVQKHYKGKLSHQKDDAAAEKQDVDGRAERIQKNYDGKSSSDDLGPSHYNGKLEHGDDASGEKRKSRIRADELEAESGDAGTDDLGPSQYKGKLEYSETQRKARYDGKSDTDDLGDGHYSNQPGSSGASLKKKRSVDEDDEGDTFGEDPETDRFGRRKPHPLDAKRRSHDTGEGETDDLGSNHWSNKKAPGERSDDATTEKQRSPKQPGAAKKTWDDDDDDDATAETQGRERPSHKPVKPRPASAFEDVDESESTSKDSEGREQTAKKIAKPRVSNAFEDDDADEESPAAASADKKRSGAGDASSAKGRLGGKSSTDDLGAGHYGKASVTKKPSNRHEQDDEEEVEDESPAASSIADLERRRLEKTAPGKKSSHGTDDLGKSHYAGKVNRAEASADDEALDDAEGTQSPNKKYTAKKPGEAHGRDGQTSEESDERRTRDPKAFEKALDKRARAISDLLPDGNADEETDQAHAASDKVSELRREKKMRSIADLLPDGNAEDPQEEIRPRGEAGSRTQEEAARSKVKPHLVKSPAEREASERTSAEAVAKAAVPSLSETAPVGDDGKPVVASEAKVVVILRKKSEPGVERIIQLDDFFEDTAFIHMHGNPLAAGDAIELTMTFEYLERTKRIQVSGVCLESDANDEGEAFCTIKIEATQLKIFEQFMLLYQLRQQHIHSFLKAAKGY